MGPAYPSFLFGMNASAGKMYSFSVHVISISLLLFTDLSNSSLTKYLNCLHSKPAPPGQNELVKKTKKEKFNNKDPSFQVNYVLCGCYHLGK